MAEAQARFQVQAGFVRAAMPLHVVDAREHLAVDGARLAQVEDAGDAAHDGGLGLGSGNPGEHLNDQSGSP